MLTHSNPLIQRLIDEIDEAYSNMEHAKFDSLNQQLYELAKEHDDALAGLIYRYNDLNHDFDAQRFDECAKGIQELISPFMEHEATYYVLRCYNTLGIIESERAQYYECLGYYIKALQVAEKHPEYHYSAILANNIGNLFVWFNEFEQGLVYLLKAFDLYEAEHLSEDREKAVIIINIIECYGCLGQYHMSYKWIDVPLDYTDNERCVIDNLYMCNKMEEAFEKNAYNELATLYDKILNNIQTHDEFIYHFRSLLRALKICIKEKNRIYCKRFINIMDMLHKHVNITTFSYDYAELKMKYYDTYYEQGDEDFMIYSDEYYKQSSFAIHQLRKTYAQSMALRLDLEKVKDERLDVIHKNEILEKNLELDPFTKLYNKEGFKKHCVETLRLFAADCKHALLVLDIDHFKQVNDVYGHKAGDEVLLLVAKLLKSVANEHIFVGRFGGDEFILFYKNFKDIKDVLDLAKALVYRANKIMIPNTVNSQITFSIGVHTDGAYADFEEMFFNADKALYDCKKQGRNGYRLYNKE